MNRTGELEFTDNTDAIRWFEVEGGCADDCGVVVGSSRTEPDAASLSETALRRAHKR